MKTLLILLLLFQDSTKFNYKQSRCWEDHKKFTVIDKVTHFYKDGTPYNIKTFYKDGKIEREEWISIVDTLR